MRHSRTILFLALFALAVAGPAAAAEPVTVILATTTSTQDTGLLDVLVAAFHATHPEVRIKPIAVGTGEALAMGRRGDADLLLVHAREAEDEFMAQGHGLLRLDVMHNDFVLVGPPSDPAGARGLPVREALGRIASSGALFLSRGDKSGTHARELALWKLAGQGAPAGRWYRETGQGMGATARIASEKRAYTLMDRGTFLALRSTLDLAVMSEGGDEMLNRYGAIVVNPAAHPRVKAAQARVLAEWLVSRDGQRVIGEFGKDRFGQPLFVPDAAGTAERKTAMAADDDPLGAVAERYVKLVLAVGRHDAGFVDAYYGLPAWKAESETGEARPLPELLAEARTLVTAVRRAPATPRQAFLAAQLVAVEAYLRKLGGEPMSLANEARLLFDIEPLAIDPAVLEKARAALEAVVPGEGGLEARMEAFRKQFQIPPERLEKVVNLTLAELRRRTAALVALPAGERFEVAFVSNMPWGAYNWYQGGFVSRIEINTDSPLELDRVPGLLAHEGYPGHHVYNALLEDRLVKGKGWVEYTVYPLHSPQSLIAEGTANVGLDIVFPREERQRFVREVLAPAAGLAGLDWERLEKVREASKPLRLASTLAASALLDEGKPEAEVMAILMRLGLQSPERAKRGLSFIRGYRSYVYTYWVGEDLIEAWLDGKPDRTAAYFDLLQRPVVPSEFRPAPAR
ncbi:MAG TPA: substrate-binding domain-containing protein [Thermoanaerobaculaceae bacterium]|nr:substrate-binding domain-containing protein [Thermoanaerobaculaceae bacterium]HRS16440.1 substrate-binding domain-containing protein [Thermoanaerobaculaceae bacterium]